MAIADCLTSTTHLFADDTMIYMAVKSKADAQILQQDLQKLERWESTCMMEFHSKKCQIISISRKRNPTTYQYTLHGHELEHVQVIKHLGTSISHNLKWDQHADNIVAKANRTQGFLRRNLNIGNIEAKQQAYFSLARPILEYSSTVWNSHNEILNKKLEGVQRRAASFTLHRYRHTSSVGDMLHGLEWQSLEDHRRVADLSIFYKIHNGRVAVDMPDALIRMHQNTGSRNRNTQAYHITGSQREYHRMAFFQRTGREWNNLLEATVLKKSPDTFKNILSNN